MRTPHDHCVDHRGGDVPDTPAEYPPERPAEVSSSKHPDLPLVWGRVALWGSNLE